VDVLRHRRGGLTSTALLTAIVLATSMTIVIGFRAWGASPVSCKAGQPNNLQSTMDSAAARSTVAVSGTCTGNFEITHALTLVGAAILDGNGTGTVLTVDAGVNATLDYITVQHGNTGGNGGGIYNGGTLTLNSSTASSNTAAYGGGLYNNAGTVTLRSSQLSGNTVTVQGGGSYNSHGTLTLNSSKVSDNTGLSGGPGVGSGAGILNDTGTLTLNGSDVS